MEGGWSLRAVAVASAVAAATAVIPLPGGGSAPGVGLSGGGSAPGVGLSGGGSPPGVGLSGGGSPPGVGLPGGGSAPGVGLPGGGSPPGIGGVSITFFFFAQAQVLVVVSLDPANAGTVTGVAMHRAFFFSGLDLTVSSGSFLWWFA